MDQRILSPQSGIDELAGTEDLRPRSFGYFIGQDEVKTKLQICIEAAKLRGEALDHVLLAGPPGLGKTTLAHIIAAEMNVNLRVTSGPVMERKADLAEIGRAHV